MNEQPNKPHPAAEALQIIRENAAKIAANFHAQIEQLKKELNEAEKEAQRLRVKLFDTLEAKNAAQIELFLNILTR